MRDYLKTNDGDPTESFAWGNEVSRLAPPGPFVPSIVATGKPPNIHTAPPAGFGEGPEPVFTHYFSLYRVVNLIYSGRLDVYYASDGEYRRHFSPS